MPERNENYVKERYRLLNIAHRGARSLAPENTIAAARKALEIGAAVWELDVRMSRDKELVVIHDATLKRTSNVKKIFSGRKPWSVRNFTLAEIQRLDFGSWFNKTDPFGQITAGRISQKEQISFEGIEVLTLREALEFTRKNNWKVNIEIKSSSSHPDNFEPVEKIVALINRLGMKEMVIVSSFDQAYVKKVKQLDPGIPTGLLVDESLAHPVNCLKRINADAYHPEISVIDLSKIRKLRNEGFCINVWTVNDERTMRDLIRVRVDGIITDFPQNLESILRERAKV